MKKSGMLQVLLFILLLLGYGIGSAQSDYVVTVSGDTIRGKVKYFNNAGVSHSSGNTTRFVQITNDQGKKITYDILKTRSFKYKDDVYHTIKFNQGYTFMKLLHGGYLSLYAYQSENQTSWDGRYFTKKDASLLDIPNISFKKKVTQFLSDCPALVSKIETGELGKSELITIVTEYNTCNRTRVTAQPIVTQETHNEWLALEKAVNDLPLFDKKGDALEMIRDVQAKLSRKEAIPSFLLNGIKDALKDQSGIKTELDAALAKIK